MGIEHQSYPETRATGAQIPCRLCGSPPAETLAIPERQRAGGDASIYIQCAGCGCLQIVDHPGSVTPPCPDFARALARPGLKQKLRLFLAVHGPQVFFGRRDWWLAGAPRSIRDSGIKKTDAILDIGCGPGDFIASLHEIGFPLVFGADPRIRKTFRHPNGVEIARAALEDIPGPFDLVMMHHVLERIWDQKAAAAHLFRMLAPGGRCIVRLPTVDSWCWDNYGADWVHAGAPYHFYLHSRDSIARLLQDAGFADIRILDDADATGILASQKLQDGFVLLEEDITDPDFRSHFPAHAISSAAEQARRLNAASRGDCIAVHAVRPANTGQGG